jgi:hypothetical protein
VRRVFSIPMRNGVDSLNIAKCAGRRAFSRDGGSQTKRSMRTLRATTHGRPANAGLRCSCTNACGKSEGFFELRIGRSPLFL